MLDTVLVKVLYSVLGLHPVISISCLGPILNEKKNLPNKPSLKKLEAGDFI